MKNLLSMIALSTIAGTSASNLKPVFTNATVSNSFKSNQLNNKNISMQNQNDKNPFSFAQINSKINLKSIFILSDGTIYAIENDKLIKSNNNGCSFLPVSTIPNNYSISEIAIDPNGTIYLGTIGLLKLKSDGNFEKVKDVPDINITSLATAPNGTIYAGSNDNGTVYKSTDGNTFKEMSGAIGKIQFLVTDNASNVYAGTNISSSQKSVVYKSTDGNTFTAMFELEKDPIYSLATAPNGTIYVGTYEGIVYKSTDGNTFKEMSGANGTIWNLVVDINNNVYAGTGSGLYISNGTDKFILVNNIPSDAWIKNVVFTNKDTIYVSTENKGLWITNPINLLLKVNKPDTFYKSWPLYKGIVYNSVQKIDVQENLVANATLDGKTITVPTTDLDIPVGEHNLILTLKDKTLASSFGGDPNTGQVTYKLWVKTAIDKNKIDYQTKIDDTQLYTGLVSNAGNTNNADIIQTKIKDGTGRHNASININFQDILIDFDVNKSFYEQGTVNETTNDFKATGSKQGVSKNLSITTDGIYHLHLVDTVGNEYDSYLELGKSNWKLTGTFDDKNLTELANKLNVTVNESNPIKKTEAMGWLQNYKIEADKQFRNVVQTNGKGFDISIDNDLNRDYKLFLDPINYVDNKTQYAINQTKLNDKINKIAEEKIQDGLTGLPKNLNVNTSNVVNKSTLDNYSAWIKNYQDFINKNKDKWINEIEKIASRGFATDEQENKIEAQVSQFLNNDNIKNYLKNIVWEDNKLLKTTSIDYQQYVKLEKLKNDTIDWVNTNMKDIDIAYQNAIKDAESGLNLHGYSIDTLLNGKPKPQTKTEIANFADGKSYHDWLQDQADIKFKGYQLAMGFGIGIPLLLVVVAIAWVIRSRTNPKYNPISRGKQIKKEKQKIINKEK